MPVKPPEKKEEPKVEAPAAPDLDALLNPLDALSDLFLGAEVYDGPKTEVPGGTNAPSVETKREQNSDGSFTITHLFRPAKLKPKPKPGSDGTGSDSGAPPKGPPAGESK